MSVRTLADPREISKGVIVSAQDPTEPVSCRRAENRKHVWKRRHYREREPYEPHVLNGLVERCDPSRDECGGVFFHLSLPALDSRSKQQTRIVVEQRRAEQNAIDSVEHSAVSGQQISGVFNAGTTLQH